MIDPSNPGPAPRSASAAETHGGWYDVFFHRRVLRAGWGLLLFAVLVTALVLGQSVALRSVERLQDVPHAELTPHDFTGNLVSLVAVALATVAVTLLEQRRLQDYGFAGRHAGRLLILGVCSGGAIMAALLGGLHALGLVSVQGPAAVGVAEGLGKAVVWIGFAAVVAVVEESLLRGYLQFGLTRGGASILRNYFGARSGVALAFWIAGSVLSLVYGAMHSLNADESTLGICSTALLGLLYVLSLWRTGSLWWALGFHVAWDFLQSFVFGTAASGLRIRDHLFVTAATGPAWKSGGATGPEGSVFIFAALAVTLGIVLLLPRRTVYPELWVEADLDIHDQDADTLPDPDRSPAQ